MAPRASRRSIRISADTTSPAATALSTETPAHARSMADNLFMAAPRAAPMKPPEDIEKESRARKAASAGKDVATLATCSGRDCGYSPKPRSRHRGSPQRSVGGRAPNSLRASSAKRAVMADVMRTTLRLPEFRTLLRGKSQVRHGPTLGGAGFPRQCKVCMAHAQAQNTFTH